MSTDNSSQIIHAEGNATVTGDYHVTLQVSRIKLKIIYYCLGIFGMLGNLLVLYVIVRSKNMRTKITNMYILNQSLADFLGAFFMLMTSLFEEPKRKLSGFADEVYCRMWLTKWLLWAMFTVSTYNLILGSIERYLAVVHAVWHKTSFNKNKAIASMVSVWVLSLLYIACYMIIPVQMKDGLCQLFNKYATPQAQSGAGIFNFVLLFLIPIVILIFCYAQMARKLHSRIHPSGQSSNQMGRAMRNVIKTLALVSICFILCWVCNQIYYLMFTLGYPADFTSTFYHCTVVAIFCNCCINPIIYVLKYESFQRNLRRLMPWLPRLTHGGCDIGGEAQPAPGTATPAPIANTPHVQSMQPLDTNKQNNIPTP